jgi:hypothetical protein
MLGVSKCLHTHVEQVVREALYHQNFQVVNHSIVNDTCAEVPSEIEQI